MKYVIVIPDGCADEPQEQLGGKTPLEAANTPAMDAIAKQGVVGVANHTPENLPAGSSVANMSLLGYDPQVNYTGRAPIEAAAQGIELADEDWCIRCNLVSIDDQIMKSFTAGHISSEEAQTLLKTAQEKVNDDRLEFIPGVSYRNLLMYRPAGGPSAPFSNDTRATPPHDLSDKTVENDFPRGPGSDMLVELMHKSNEWFADHEVNSKRTADGKLPATNVWLWGLGRKPKLASFESIHGYTDTDYAAKGDYALDAIDKYDIVCVHIEAPDEASHEGDLGKKVKALEEIDTHIVAKIHKKLESMGTDYRILVTPDHPTYISTKTHTHGNVPFTICGAGVDADSHDSYNEVTCEASGLKKLPGDTLMKYFIGK